MKYRRDFITNSSSSSFIFGVKDKNDVRGSLLGISLAKELEIQVHATRTATPTKDQYQAYEKKLVIPKDVIFGMLTRYTYRAIAQGYMTGKHTEDRWKDSNHMLVPKKDFLEGTVSNLYYVNEDVPHPFWTQPGFSQWLDVLEETHKTPEQLTDWRVIAKAIKAEFGVKLDIKRTQQKDHLGKVHVRYNWNYADRSPFFEKYWLNANTLSGITRKNLVIKRANAWWDRHVGDTGVCVKLEFGDSHGIGGLVENSLEYLFWSIKEPDVIAVSNH